MDIAAKLIPRLFALLMLMAALCAASLYSPRANAQTPTTGCAVAAYCGFWYNKADAQAQCLSDKNGAIGTDGYGCSDTTATATSHDGLTWTKGFFNLGHTPHQYYFYFYYCNAGTTWNGSTCSTFDCSSLTNPSSADYVNPSVDGLTPLAYAGSADKCINGCRWSLKTTPRVSTTLNGTLVQMLGFYKPTGDATTCSGPQTPSTAPLADSDPKCITYATGQTFCKYADGHECFTATTGRQLCWGQAQTGNKTDGPVNQQRVGGSAPSTAPPPPSGDTIAQSGSSATSQTVANPGTTTTTNTTNYATTNGTDAGTSNQGQPSGSTPTDSSSSTSSSSSATGGNCSAAYTCSSSNGVECAMLEEQRKARCSIESEKAGVTGGTTCSTPPACAGAKCDADAYHIILQAWKTRCAVESSNTKLDGIASAIAAGNGKLDDLKGSVDAGNDELADIGASVSSINSALHSDGGTPDGADDDELGPGGTAQAQGFGEEVEYGDEGLDDSGFGLPRTCPSPPTFQLAGHTFVFDMTYICFAPSIESALLLMLVGIWCLMFIVRD